jgi:hypothetical protein
MAAEPDECKAVTPGKAPSAADNPDNIENDTKAELASEWMDVQLDKQGVKPGVEHVLDALQLLTSGSVAPSLGCQVLDELRLVNPDHSRREDPCKAAMSDPDRRQGLYQAAMGDPDESGQGLSTFVDTLAKANTLHLKKPRDEVVLFGCTEKLIDIIFNNNSKLTPFLGETKKNRPESERVAGPVVLTRINRSFSGKDNNVALYQLLDAYPKPSNDTERQIYTRNLEKLRAAFEMDTDSLAKQVAAKITAQK